MKKQFFGLAFIASFLLFPTNGNSHIFPATPTFNFHSDEIDLRGRIEPGEIRRTENAISAFLETAVIRSQFHFDVGTLQISIANATGSIVYNNTVSSSIGELLIPIAELSTGNYSITFTSNSGMMTGDFVL